MSNVIQFSKQPLGLYEEKQLHLQRLIGMRLQVQNKARALLQNAKMLKDHLLQIEMAIDHQKYELEQFRNSTRWKA